MKQKQSKSLKGLLADWARAVANSTQPQPPSYDGPDVMLVDLVEHTDAVRPGSCFVARVRTGSDGHVYVGKAVEKGASLVVGQRPPAELGLTVPEEVVYLEVEDTAVAMAWLAAAWYGFPSQQLVTVGVTGTDGKTTTTNLIYNILQAAGLKTGMLSTIKAVIGPVEEPLALHVTTPEAPVMQRYLRRMVDAGLTHCVLETTSHSLAQHRVAAVDFDVAVVTNITHEHLDYHGGYEAYYAAKARLFEYVAKTAVLNRDDGSYERLVKIKTPMQITYGIEQPADVYATDLIYAADETRFTLHLPHSPAPPLPRSLSSSLVGEFNVYNMLAAAAAAHALQIAPAHIQQGVEIVRGLSGRMERIDRGQPFPVIVDFAHTPNSLEKTIAAARRITDGRIIAVFGSAGKRDVEKRRLMAEIAARDADLTVLTAEDPRTESLDEILAMMAAGCRSQGGVEGQTFWRVPDRGQAIYFSLTLARPQDLILILGKGHEQSMCFGTTEYPWDDRQAVREALDALLDERPMVDLGLPTFRDDS